MKVKKLLSYSEFDSGVIVKIYEYNNFLDKYEVICYGRGNELLLIADTKFLNSNVDCYDISYQRSTIYFNIYLK